MHTLFSQAARAPRLATWLVALLALAATATSSAMPLLEVFVREGCPHCAAAKAFLPDFAARHPGLAIRYREVDRDPQARDDLVALCETLGQWPPAVPAFHLDDQLLIGFESAAVTGAALDTLLTAAAPAPSALEHRWLGEVSVQRFGLPLFTLVIGLLDGFNPCAMWVLLFLLSMLVHLRDRWRMALIAGTFVGVSGLVYYAFMAAWLNVFLAVGMGTALRLGLAGLAFVIGALNLADGLRRAQHPTFAIPETAKPGLYARIRRILQAPTLGLALAAAAALAVVVNLVELLCTAGLPALYTAVLASQDLDSWRYHGYLALYIAGYIADDTLMVASAVAALGSRRLGPRTGQGLKVLSGAVMVGLGLVMLLAPQWL
ncbi:MAG: NrdH-redoxin [Gammaproteobacteria bacterium]|nr:NrdH-redoxin [Gammaproteobacteria bacterium]